MGQRSEDREREEMGREETRPETRDRRDGQDGGGQGDGRGGEDGRQGKARDGTGGRKSRQGKERGERQERRRQEATGRHEMRVSRRKGRYEKTGEHVMGGCVGTGRGDEDIEEEEGRARKGARSCYRCRRCCSNNKESTNERRGRLRRGGPMGAPKREGEVTGRRHRDEALGGFSEGWRGASAEELW